MKPRLTTHILFFYLFIFLLYSPPIYAQTEHDCTGAINIVSPINTFPAYYGTGTLNEINPQVSSCLQNEINSVWLTFTMCDTGYCLFKIAPTELGADYDWALYNLTNKTCENVFDTLFENELRCNYSAIPGATGLDTPYVLTSSGAGGPNMCASKYICRTNVITIGKQL
ncbi:MAG: hypothetical protein IPG39_11805 [Bacteroidetes bacterium]|nr:hypothetical protein [Bacteroidota bacterium]